MPDPIYMTPIGWVSSVFKEKFGAPRQSGVVPSATGEIHFHPPYGQKDAFQEIEGFSHLWVISQFHLIPQENFRPKVRPPKLGGEKKVGVFASRAPYRPNRICMTVVKLEKVMEKGGVITLHISGLDLVDGTPVLDVKPYIPYADALPEARTSFGMIPAGALPVILDREEMLEGIPPGVVALVKETLQAQPEPAYASPVQSFGMTLGEYNIKWGVKDDAIILKEIIKKNC